MTVEVLPPFASDFGDLSKQLGLLDSMDPFTEDELALLEAGTFDFPGVVSGPTQAVVPDLGACWGVEDAAYAQQGATDGPCTLVGASSGTVVPDFVKLDDLHAAQLPAAARSPSPASSGSHTSCYDPSCDGGSSDFTESPSPAATKKDPRIGKRKPEVDLSTIDDPAERRKQRRLAKNRATAATSRERKRKQLTELQHRVSKLEADKAHLAQLLARRDSEVAALRSAAHVRAPH